MLTPENQARGLIDAKLLASGWGRYRDENGIERRVPLAADKAAAQAMLTELVRKAELRASGVVDRYDEHRKRPITGHLDDFVKYLNGKGVTSEQVKLVEFRARRIVDRCKIVFISDVSASRVNAFLADLRTAHRKSTQTSNHYLRAIKQFTRWLVRDRRAIDDPLSSLAMLSVLTDRKHDRRPFIAAELAAIRQAALDGPIVRRMSGPDRAMLYTCAAYTGLRASELASLTRASFNLESDHPVVKVEAAYSKHRREDILPLHESLVALLGPWLAAKPLNEPVWPGCWAKGKEAEVMLKHDLKTAGIPYKDESGRYADFHALRHTFITNMVKAGIAPKSAQSLARHSTIDLTMNVYTSLTVHDQASALAALPPILAPGKLESTAAALQATGTDGPKKVPTVVPRSAEIGAIRLASQTYEVAPNCTHDGVKSVRMTNGVNARNPGEGGVSCASLHQSALVCAAEREGFEPSVRLPAHRFSRPAHSTALAPLRVKGL
jgi:integrase/recombinase XerD